ncbi:hypothetical protein HAX54_002860 [Datura stramonium]|uniref:Uncharacterized protein n=1 Tax=Datura stramonium TaxID=4076 RepID=A0ABS8WVQ1_DATST|nr:hypothetical protein [Datura stramonium]
MLNKVEKNRVGTELDWCNTGAQQRGAALSSFDDGVSSVNRRSCPAKRRLKCRRQNTGKGPITNAAPHELDPEEVQRILQLCFAMDRMEAYYLSFKENRSITAKAQFEVASFNDDFPDIYNQIDIRDWGPFTIPVGPYFPELV